MKNKWTKEQAPRKIRNRAVGHSETRKPDRSDHKEIELYRSKGPQENTVKERKKTEDGTTHVGTS